MRRFEGIDEVGRLIVTGNALKVFNPIVVNRRDIAPFC
jgi:hypothetical protein